jgi:hypothetical protein
VTAPGAPQEQPATAISIAPIAPPRLAQPTAPAAAPAAASIVVTPRLVNEPQKKPAVKPASNHAKPVTSLASASPAAVVDPPKHEEPATTPAVPEAPTSTTASTTSALPPPVTVTGCLEVSTDGDTFRLSDVEGIDAPKSRSWRTGFMKKRPAPVMLVDPPDRQALTTNVGRRVAATGQLANHDLKLATLHVVSSSCN